MGRVDKTPPVPSRQAIAATSENRFHPTFSLVEGLRPPPRRRIKNPSVQDECPYQIPLASRRRRKFSLLRGIRGNWPHMTKSCTQFGGAQGSSMVASGTNIAYVPEERRFNYHHCDLRG